MSAPSGTRCCETISGSWFPLCRGRTDFWSVVDAAGHYGPSGHGPSPSCRCDVDEAQLHALLAVPTIDRERAGRMHGAPAIVEERNPELLAGGPERDDVE